MPPLLEGACCLHPSPLKSLTLLTATPELCADKAPKIADMSLVSTDEKELVYKRPVFTGLFRALFAWVAAPRATATLAAKASTRRNPEADKSFHLFQHGCRTGHDPFPGFLLNRQAWAAGWRTRT